MGRRGDGSSRCCERWVEHKPNWIQPFIPGGAMALGRTVDAGDKGRAEGTLSWGALCAGEMDSGTDSGLGALHFLWHNTNALFPWQTWVAEKENFWLIHMGFVWYQRPPLNVFFPDSILVWSSDFWSSSSRTVQCGVKWNETSHADMHCWRFPVWKHQSNTVPFLGPPWERNSMLSQLLSLSTQRYKSKVARSALHTDTEEFRHSLTLNSRWGSGSEALCSTQKTMKSLF